MKPILIGALLVAGTIAGLATASAEEFVVRGRHAGYVHHERHAVVIRHGRDWHRHDRGLHRGWEHSRHYGARAKVVIR